MDSEKIKRLISKGMTREALEEVINVSDGEIKKIANRLLLDFQTIKRTEILGIATREEIFKKCNDISMDCLTLVDSIAAASIANHHSDSRKC